ncbi:MAG: hypothetical protein LQ345_005379, partial [Seirophora villosa]
MANYQPNGCSGIADGTDQLLCRIQDPYSGTFHADAFWAALGTSIAVMILITLAFSLMRPRNNIVYAPKVKYADEKHAPPKIGKGIFEWVGPVFRAKESLLVEKTGLDAAVFLRFTKMLRNIFLILSLLGIAVLIPANVIGADKNYVNSTNFKGGQSYFVKMTPSYPDPKRHGTLWVHVVAAWAIDMVVAFFLWRNYGSVVRLRRQYFDSPEYLMSLHSRTLLVTDIPPADRTDEGILRLADQVEHTAGLPRAAIGRNVKVLPDMIEEHDEAVRELESVLAKYLKNPDKLPTKRPTMRPSKKYRANNGSDSVDAIDYLTGRIRELETEIGHVRESIDKRNAMPFGFASYDRIEDAHTVAFAARKKHPQGTTIRLAPKPNDLIWRNLPLSKKQRGWRRFWNNFWIAMLTLVWIAPNALIAIFIANLSNLAAIWPGFKRTYETHQKFWSAVQGIASPALTSLIYLILPIIFRRMSIRSGDATKTSRERHVTTKLYNFFVFNNLIVFSVFSVIYQFVVAVVSNSKIEGAWEAVVKANFFWRLSSSLSTSSYFWVIWLLQRQLGAAADLAQIINLIWTWFCRTFMAPTPRQEIEWTAPPPFDYAVYYNYFLFYATVALCFSTLQPLVLPITALYFAIDLWLKKYLLLYVLITKTESGGQFWRILFNRMVFAVCLANVVMGLVIRGADGGWFKVFFVIPPAFLMLGVKYYCSKTFDDQMKYFTKATLKDPGTLAEPGKKVRKNDRIASRFGHPALYKPLMTPMVHAKARHVLSQIYRGRLDNSDNVSVAGYSDIAMDPMSQKHPGKTAHFAPPAQREMFEVVPEAKLDFQHFMNRAEFAEALGGNGELYGRPDDLISERSSTPRSFLGRHGSGSGNSSRASSPGAASERSAYGHQRAGSGSPYRSESPYRSRDHSQGDLGQRGRGMYQMDNDSQNRLLHGAQPFGQATPDEEVGREVYGLDRWRTGGSGYVGLPARETDDGGITGPHGMSLQIYIAHTGQRLSTPTRYSTLEGLQSWIAQNSSVEPQDQILMTARGKQVKLQTLSLETDIFVYNRQILSASAHANLSSSLPATPTPHPYHPEAAPGGPHNRNDPESWQRLFGERKVWALELQEHCTAIATQIQQLDGEATIIQRSAAIAVENVKQHIANLRPKFEDSKIWADNVLQDQAFLLDEWERILGKYPSIPTIEALGMCLSGKPAVSQQHSSPSASVSGTSLYDCIDIAEVTKASIAGKASCQRFRSRANDVNVAFADVEQKADTIVENFNRDANLSDSSAAEQSGHLLEEVQVMTKKIDSDHEHVLGLSQASNATNQMSRIALLHARSFIPTLLQTAGELDQLLRQTVERKNGAQASSVQYLQNISRVESRIALVHTKLTKLDIDPEDGQAFDLLGSVTRLPSVYGLLLVECVRRLEWTDKITTDSSTLVEEVATFKEEEIKRRKKWMKDMEGAVDLGSIDDMSVNIDINVQAEKQRWPTIGRQDIHDYVNTLRDLAGLDDAVKEIGAATATLDSPTKQQSRRAKAFKNGSIHETAYGRNSLLLRGDDEIIHTLKSEKSKLEDKVRSSDSRIRKLEDLLHRQSQASRPSSSSGNPFNIQAPVIGFPPSMARPQDPASRRSSVSSRRISTHAETDEKSLGKRIASLEGELLAEKAQSAGLQKDALTRGNVEDNLKAQVREALSVKEDLLGNFEAQQREFEDERRLLEGDNLKLKIRLEEAEDELDQVIGSRDREGRSHATEEEVQKIRDEHESLREENARLRKQNSELQAQSNQYSAAEADHHATLQSAVKHLVPDAKLPVDFTQSVHAVEDATRKHKSNLDEMRQLLEEARRMNEELESRFKDRGTEVQDLQNRLADTEMEGFSTRESLAENREELKRVRD